MDEYAVVVNVDTAVVRDGTYLLVERAPNEPHAGGVLGFPGGKLEAPPGTEAAIERTAIRELHEEVGLDVGSVTYVTSKTFLADDGTRCLNVVVLCEGATGQAHVNASDEIIDVFWLAPDAIRAHEQVPPYIETYVERVEAVRTAR